MRVLVQRWEVSELGWGTSEDGISIHFSEEQANEYDNKHWLTLQAEHGDATPDIYSRPVGSTVWMIVDQALATPEVIQLVLAGKTIRTRKSKIEWLKSIDE